MEFDDELRGVLRDFIESLNFDNMPEPMPWLSPDDASEAYLSPRYIPDESRLTHLARDIHSVLSLLADKSSPLGHWSQNLNWFELRVRSILQEEILNGVQRHYKQPLSEDDLRSIIAFSVSLGWLVMNSLIAMYRNEDYLDNLGLGDGYGADDDF